MRNMYVVWVEFRVRSDRAEDFLQQVRENARISREESGCRQFDVCVQCDNANRVALYEIYDNRQAFDEHLATEHFLQFDATVAEWVEEKRIETFHLQ